MPNYSLKSGKEVLEVEFEAGESFEDFQAKVFALTDVPPKNLKLLFKGKMIKDNQALLGLPAGSQLIVMGTKTGKELKEIEVPKGEKMEIEEDYQIPQRYGLVNIGNTCYMNAAIQLLRNIPELNKLIKGFKPNNNQNIDQAIVKNLGNVFAMLDGKDFSPQIFVTIFLQTHQDYLPLGTQHDSDEFLQQLISILTRSGPQIAAIIKDLFQIEYVQVTKNADFEEQPKYEITHSTKLCCSMGGTEKDFKIGTLTQGIRLTLDTKLQKLSEVDNLNHTFEKKIRFSNLPPYLLVQMVRFFWKEASGLPGSKPTAAKICKTIQYSQRTDIFDFCSEELQKKLQEGRDALEEAKKVEEAEYKKEYEAYKESVGQTNRPEKRLQEEFNEKWKQKQKPLTEGLQTGYYDLIATVTHLGNSVESGHYMAWVKENEEEWTKYDDNTVYQQPSEKVSHLRGGQPNLEIAYVLLFKKVYAKPL